MKQRACLIKYICAFLALISAASIAYGALPPEQLESAIQEKARELERIQKELDATQKNLAETEHKKTSLAKEIGTIKKNITQLDLGIKSNQTKIQKLGLEIDALKYDIAAAEGKIRMKEGAVKNILVEMQGLDDESPLLTFLKNKTLAEGVEAQARLNEVSADLSGTIGELKRLNDERAAKLATASDKKADITGEYKTLTVRKTLVKEQEKDRQIVLATTKNKEKEFQKTIETLAKQQSDIAAEVEAMEAALRAQIN